MSTQAQISVQDGNINRDDRQAQRARLLTALTALVEIRMLTRRVECVNERLEQLEGKRDER